MGGEYRNVSIAVCRGAQSADRYRFKSSQMHFTLPVDENSTDTCKDFIN